MKSSCWQGQAPSRSLRGKPSWPLPASGGPGRPLAWGCLPPVSACAFPWPPPHPASPLPSVSSLLIGTLIIGLGPAWVTQDDLIPRSFITSVGTLFLNSQMFWMYISLGEEEAGHDSPTTEGFIQLFL